jgi:small subunit ribosomal protein S20
MADNKEPKKAKKRPTAEKRHEQSLKRQERNAAFKAKVKTAIRSFEKAVTEGNKEIIATKLSSVYSLLDKGVKTNKFKQNFAARKKSRLASTIPA